MKVENKLFKWTKCDLHFHTPVSNKTKKDYPTKATPKQIVNKLKQFNLGLVAITDHNMFSLEQFNLLKIEAGSEITFLLGVELKVDKYDVILIIDPLEKSLLNFDNKINEYCNENRSGSYGTTANLVQVFKDFNYILIPEYNRGGGAEKVHKIGTEENDKFKLQLLAGFYDAADIKNVGKYKNTTSYHIKNMFKIADIARDGNYLFVTDNHDINYYPHQNAEKNNTFRGWTFINSEPTFNGLKMALSDSTRFFITPDINGSPPFLKNRDEFLINKLYIKNIEKNEEKEINMSPFLNCIVGPRSSGKSYLAKKVVSKFNKNEEKKFQAEYKNFWEKYEVKIKFFNGDIIDYNEYSNSQKIIYLQQNHLIENIENNNNLFQNWYEILEISAPKIDEYKLSIKKQDLQNKIKQYYLSILELRNKIKELNFKTNIFRSSDLLINKRFDNNTLLNRIKSNIQNFNNKIENNVDFFTLNSKVDDLKLNNFYINKNTEAEINKIIEKLSFLLKKSEKIKERLEKGLFLVENFLISSLKKMKQMCKNLLKNLIY